MRGGNKHRGPLLALIVGWASWTAPVLLAPEAVREQDVYGSIVGWGYEVVVGQGEIEGLVAVAGGYGHSVGLRADGSIVAWGQNDYGQCDVQSPNTGFVAVAGGGSHSLGLKADGSIRAWGRNSESQCNVPSPNTGFVAVAAGEWHSLGLKADGSIVAWGHNGYGQCNVPSPNIGFVAVAAGQYHSLGLKGCTSGDFDCDNDVDASDYWYIHTGIGFCVAQSNYISHLRADMDSDGCISFVDYQLWLECYRDFVGDPLAAPPTGGGMGDANGDGDIDGRDVRGFVTAVIEPGNVTPAVRAACDFNGDGDVDAGDVDGFVGVLLGV